MAGSPPLQLFDGQVGRGPHTLQALQTQQYPLCVFLHCLPQLLLIGTHEPAYSRAGHIDALHCRLHQRGLQGQGGTVGSTTGYAWILPDLLAPVGIISLNLLAHNDCQPGLVLQSAWNAELMSEVAAAILRPRTETLLQKWGWEERVCSVGTVGDIE